MNFIIKKIIGYLGGKLDGYKTKIGGFGFILSGVVGIIGIMFPDQNMPKMDLQDAILLISGGITALGIGGKIEKQIKATDKQTEVINSIPESPN